MKMLVVVQQGERGRWRWLVQDRSGNTLAISADPRGFQWKEEAVEDAAKKLSDMALFVRPKHWWEFSAEWSAMDRVREHVVYTESEARLRAKRKEQERLSSPQGHEGAGRPKPTKEAEDEDAQAV